MYEIIEHVWGMQEGAYVSLPQRLWIEVNGQKVEQWKEGPLVEKSEGIKLLKDRVANQPIGCDVYFCPHTFVDKTKGRVKDNVSSKLPCMWADLDVIDPNRLAMKPSLAWKSSDNSYQGLWLLEGSHDKMEVESRNRGYCKMIGADKSGWDLTQLLRIPTGLNYKYDPPNKGKVLWENVYKRYKLDKFKADPLPQSSLAPTTGVSKIYNLPERARKLLEANSCEGEDRSERLWELEKLLIENRLPVSDIMALVKDCVWNKFKDRPNGDAHLLKDIVKAEKDFKDKHTKTTPTTQQKPKLNIGESCQSLSDLMYSNLASPAYLVNKVWQTASVGMMAGEPKTMKSMVAIDIGIAVATAKHAVNTFVTLQANVLYIQEEINRADVKNRLSKHMVSKGLINMRLAGIPNVKFHVINNLGIDITQEDQRTELENIIQKLNIKLLILDPMYMMLGDSDENSANDLRPVLQWLTSIREKYNCSVLVVHHYKKGETKRAGQRMRGSSILHAWIENGLYLEVHKKDIDGCMRLDREFRSFKSDGPMMVTFSGIGKEYDVEVDDLGGVTRT